MRKILRIPGMLLSMWSMTACGSPDNDPYVPENPGQPENPAEDGNEPGRPAPGENGRYLVLYCSRTINTEYTA